MEVDLVVPDPAGHVLATQTSPSAAAAFPAFRMGGKRPRPHNDEFFDEGELEYKQAWQRLNHQNVYIPAIEGRRNSIQTSPPAAPWRAPHPLVCRQAPCHGELSFSSISAYEQHYDANHRHLCYTCGKPMPGERWLELHIHESHDTLVKIRRERGERTYRCFVADCPQAFKSTHGRRLHLIDRHKYPQSFNFDIVKEGSLSFEKRLRKLGLKRAHQAASAMRRTSVASNSSMEAETSPSSSREGSPSPTADSHHDTNRIVEISGPNHGDENEASTSISMDMEIDQLQASLSKLKLPKSPAKPHTPVDRPKLQPGFYRGPPLVMRNQQHHTEHAQHAHPPPNPVPVPSATSRNNTWMVPRQVKATKPQPSKSVRAPILRDVSME